MKEKTYTLPIITISIAIPLAVTYLIVGLHTKVDVGFNTKNLPLFHAILNSTTAILLLASLYFIKIKRIRAHRAANLTAVVLSAIFLISYVIYHSSNPSVKYGDLNHDGILSSHIILSGVIIPLVLFTLQRAFQERFDKHKKLARFTWPLWFYVAVSGVIVYVMISPFYA